ncbi:MAG: RsmB/NOP family class I SAM-dependent RNA methyltransferase [Pyramidobacter sp.]|nr:RsmB/NOP family class I SAM-dependent RNA methyltransferase [Pyramidobacter sp.]
MRGIDAALHIWAQVRKGAMVSEALRALGNAVTPADRTLAASLAYSMTRRLSLWQMLREKFLLPKPSKFSKHVQTAVLAGAAGLLELRTFAPAALISALVDWTKARDPRGARVVNAVLRRVLEQGAGVLKQLESDGGLEALCLLSGVPLWAAERWIDQYGDEIGRALVQQNAEPGALSLRRSPNAPADMAVRLEEAGVAVVPSPMAESIRVSGTALPSALAGYAEGFLTPQSESAMAVGKIAADFSGSRLLDMCAGRGVKTGQIAQLRPDVTVEGWDLSEGRVAAGRRDMERLGVSARVFMKNGDALLLQPDIAPDAILVDAPCSGSGTWRRHPEGKWRLEAPSLADLQQLQLALLLRAFSLVKKGGKVVYSTCSLFAEENENVAAQALAASPEIRLTDAACPFSLPRSAGSVIMPDNPWTDGFYLAAFTKINETV